jgi:hypothetical protein
MMALRSFITADYIINGTGSLVDTGGRFHAKGVGLVGYGPGLCIIASSESCK